MKHIKDEIISKKVLSVAVTNGIVTTSDSIESIKSSAKKYAMLHGSHRDHSSQDTYGD